MPRCTWQTGRGLGYHVPIFCRDLNLFYSIYFPIFNSSMRWVGNLAFLDCHSALCQYPLSSVLDCSSDNQMSQHALHGLKCGRMKTFSGFYAAELLKLKDIMDQCISIGSFSCAKWMKIFSYMKINLLYFSPDSWLISGMLKWVKSGCFENQLGQDFDNCHAAVKPNFECLFQTVKQENGEIWGWNFDYGPKLQILWSHSADIRRNDNVVITSKRRCDVDLTL